MQKHLILLLTYAALLLTVLFSACGPEQPSVKVHEAYEGPILEAYDIELLHSDSARVRVLLKAAKQLEYVTGNQDFPDGVDITFFESTGARTAHLTGDKGYYDKKENIYKVEGNVVLVSLTQHNTLKSEELYWSPQREEIYTDTYVEVTTDTEVIQGNGLTASQDFSEYEIMDVTGQFNLDDML